MVNWCLQWIHYQEAWASSYCNLLPWNSLYTGEGGLREKGLGKPNFLLNAWLFYWAHTVGLMEDVNKKGEGYKGMRKWKQETKRKRKLMETVKWERKIGMSFVFIPQGNFHLFLHLFGEQRGIIGETDVSISLSLSLQTGVHLLRFY